MQGYTRYRARACKGVRRRSGAFEGISMIYDSMRQERKARKSLTFATTSHYKKVYIVTRNFINPLYIKGRGRLYV